MSKKLLEFTKKQGQAYDLLADNNFIYYLFDGSARCGKTWLIIIYIIDYLLYYKNSRALVARYYLTEARRSVWSQTILPMLKELHTKVCYKINLSTFTITFRNGSELTLGGLETGEQLDKVMGTEWSIIYINEVVQNPYDTFDTLKTRLNHKSNPLKFICDTNPKHPKHWVKKLFIDKINPIDDSPIPQKLLNQTSRLWWHIKDNEENVSPKYIEILESMKGVKGKRLRDGVWCASAEGTVYRFDRDINVVEKPIEYVEGATVWAGWDFGISDSVFICWSQIINTPKGVQIQFIDEYTNREMDYLHYAEVVKSKPYRDVRHAGDPSGKQRNASLESWFSLLKGKGINIKYTHKYSVADQISNVNLYIESIRINEEQCPRLTEMFENWSYPKDRDGKVIEGTLPEHSEYSHAGTAVFYKIINLFPPRKSEILLP